MILGIALTAALFAFLIAFPRRLKVVALVLAAVWTATAAWVLFDWRRSSARLAAVTASAAFDPACPDPKAPIRLTIHNGNPVTLLRVTYTLEGFEPAFRVPLAFDPYQISQQPIGAFTTASTCRGLPLRNNEKAEAKSLIWRVTVVSATFE